ncbi:hypothetical protein HAX54_002633 [Datura stramonium]|uniref:Uncharacterized protein n=1 Tax=Datura stramonium TaxID=4076 RepID=A0ABS8WVC3_DATST|nr:hypothetical protein [Datura stramonium]
MYRKLERFCDIHPPSTPPPQGQDDYIVFTQICGGLGYDSSGDDYKGCLHWIASEEPRGPLILQVLILKVRDMSSYLRPAYSMTGREVLLEMDNTKFLWYSLEKKSLKHAKIRVD